MRRLDRVLQTAGGLLVATGVVLRVLDPDFLIVVGALAGGNGASIAVLTGLVGLLLLALSWWRTRFTRSSWRAPALIALLILAASGWAWSRQHQGLETTTLRFVSDGDELVGTVIRPRSEKDLPGIVIAPGSMPVPRKVYTPFAAAIARLGFVVLNFDKRGVGQSAGGDKLDERNNGGTPYLTQLGRDLAAGARALRHISGVDPERVGFVGISQGGWVIPLAAREDRRSAFALIISGPTTSPREEEVFSRLSGEEADHFGRRPPRQPLDVINAILDTVPSRGLDPRPILGELTIPIRWLFGAWDNSIPVAKSARIVDSLSLMGKPYRSWTIPEANHGLMVARGPHARLLPYWDRAVWDTAATWLRELSASR